MQDAAYLGRSNYDVRKAGLRISSIAHFPCPSKDSCSFESVLLVGLGQAPMSPFSAEVSVSIRREHRESGIVEGFASMASGNLA